MTSSLEETILERLGQIGPRPFREYLAVASIVFCPEIAHIPPGCSADQAEISEPAIEIEFNISLDRDGYECLDFVSAKILKSEGIDEYLNSPSHGHIEWHSGRAYTVAEYLALAWLENEGYIEALEAAQNDSGWRD